MLNFSLLIEVTFQVDEKLVIPQFALQRNNTPIYRKDNCHEFKQKIRFPRPGYGFDLNLWGLNEIGRCCFIRIIFLLFDIHIFVSNITGGMLINDNFFQMSRI